jgi:hypothetical protein
MQEVDGVWGRKNWPHYSLKATHLTELLNVLHPPNFIPSEVFESGSQKSEQTKRKTI